MFNTHSPSKTLSYIQFDNSNNLLIPQDGQFSKFAIVKTFETARVLYDDRNVPVDVTNAVSKGKNTLPPSVSLSLCFSPVAYVSVLDFFVHSAESMWSFSEPDILENSIVNDFQP